MINSKGVFMANLKRLICLLVALLMCLTFIVACDEEEESSSSSTSTDTSSSTTDNTPPTEDDEPEVVTSIREGEGMNQELPDGYSVPVPPNYQPSSEK